MEKIANCAWCEKGFIQRSHQHRYCSQKCKSAQANHLREVRQENPGATRQEIAQKLEEHRQQWREIDIYGAPCIVCGRKFDRHSFNTKRLICSEECRRVRMRQNSRNYYLNASRHHVKSRHRRRKALKETARAMGALDRECALCATVFPAALNTAKIYCSEECLYAATKSRAVAKALPETRTCSSCGTVFAPLRFTHYTCSAECSRQQKAKQATSLSDSATIGGSEEYREFCRRLRQEHAKVLQERERKLEPRRRARAEKEQARKERAHRRELQRQARERAKAPREKPSRVNYSLMPLSLILRSARRADTGRPAREYLRSPEGRQRLKADGVRVR